MHAVPFEVAALETYPSRDVWQAEASTLVAAMLHRWDLSPGGAYIGGATGSVLSVTQASGEPAVLKVAYPHVEGIWEAVGLQSFPVGCAPSVLAQDAWTWSILLESIAPGTRLKAGSMGAREALEAGGRLHKQLSAAAAPSSIPQLADAMRDYSAQARDRLPSQSSDLGDLGVLSLVVTAIDELDVLAGTGGSTGSGQCLIHGDYNPGNILDAGAGRWVAIDPKPLVGDPAYDLWPLVSQVGAPTRGVHPAEQLARQLAIAAESAEVDPARAARWSCARSGLNVSWYLAAGDRGQAAEEAVTLAAWATVVGY
jgi:streptomycin 6-kinase